MPKKINPLHSKRLGRLSLKQRPSLVPKPPEILDVPQPDIDESPEQQPDSFVTLLASQIASAAVEMALNEARQRAAPEQIEVTAEGEVGTKAEEEVPPPPEGFETSELPMSLGGESTSRIMSRAQQAAAEALQKEADEISVANAMAASTAAMAAATEKVAIVTIQAASRRHIVQNTIRDEMVQRFQ